MLAAMIWCAGLSAAEPGGNEVPVPPTTPPVAIVLPPLSSVKPALEAEVRPLVACLKGASPTHALNTGMFSVRFSVAPDGALQDLVRVRQSALTPQEEVCVAEWLADVRVPVLTASTPVWYAIDFQICPPEVNDVWVGHVERSSRRTEEAPSR